MTIDFLIIGAQKAGSTFVHNCLREHPDVFMPRREVSLFEDPDYGQYDVDKYKAIFSTSMNERVVGIKRPDYLARPECPERLYKHFPDVKLVIVLRNPIDRAVSAYYWYMQAGIIPVRPIEEGLRNILSGAYDVQYLKSKEIIYYGYYHEHLMRYLRYYDKKQMLNVLYDDLRDNPQETLSKVYEFLEIDKSYLAKTLTEHPKRTVYSLPRLRWLAIANRCFFYTYGYDEKNGVVLNPRVNKLSIFIYYLFVAVDRILLSFVFGDPGSTLDEQMKSILFEKYKKDICALEVLLGRDLSAWKTGGLKHHAG